MVYVFINHAEENIYPKTEENINLLICILKQISAES